MANTFQIKYLWELFPHTDFTEEYVVCEEMVEKHPSSKNRMTDDEWGSTRDITNRERMIQSVVVREYETKFIVSRNVTPAILGYAEYITITTTDNETFQVYDVQINYNKQSQGRNYIVELTFKRADNNIVNHLSSDNVLAYKTATSDEVNELSIKVVNPPMAFNQITMTAAGTGGAEYLQFDVTNDNPIFDLMVLITSLNDWFYMHSSTIDLQSLGIYSCYMQFDGTTYYRFRTNTTASVLSSNSISTPLVLDFEPDYYVDSNVKDINFTYIIYTFISPILDHSITPVAGINNQDAVEENQRINAKDLYRFKVWLKKDELWKIEYLNYALFNNVIYTEEGTTANVLVPSQVKDIYARKENRALIDLYEYDINFGFNNKVVSIYR